MKYKIKKSSMNYSSIAGIILVDQVLFRIVNPPFRVSKFTLTFNLFKYLGGTILFANLFSYP